MTRSLSFSCLLAIACSAACVKAPNVVIVDRRTALEQQAAGSFRTLDEELEQAGILPRPTPVTAAQLANAGVEPATETEDDADGLPDALRADSLLRQRCVGEALDGTLVLTPATCTGTLDVPQVTRMVERINRNRRQVWQWLEKQAGTERSAEDVKAAWRNRHIEGLVCGGQLQRADGSWEIKPC